MAIQDGEAPADNDAAFAAGLDSAIASQAEVAVAPALQDAVTTDSTVNDVSLQTPATPSWRERLGFNELTDDDAVAQVEKIKQYGGQAYQQAQYYAQQNQQLQAQLQAIQQAQQASQPQVSAQPEVPKLPWEPVQLDESYLDYIDPATGQWRENTPHQVVIGYQKQQRALRDFQARFYTKPHEVIGPLIEERAKSLVAPLQEQFAALQQHIQAQQQQQEIASLLAPHTKQFYAHDANGQVQRDQFGNPVMTQIGQDFNAATAIAQQMGFTDPRIAAVIGSITAERNDLQRRLAAMETKQAVQPQQPVRQQHDEQIYKPNGKSSNGVNRMANRGNTVSVSAGDPKALQNDRVSLESAAAKTLRELGFN